MPDAIKIKARQSDIIILNPDFSSLLKAREIAQKTYKIIKENFIDLYKFVIDK